MVRREDGERASQQGGGRAAAGRHSQVGGSIESNSLRVKVKAVWGPEREEEQPTEQSLSSLPLLSDPYEERTVEVCTSGVGGGGEGLFAKRQLEEGDLVAIYNGVKVPLVAGVEKEDWEECGYSIGYYETSNSEHGWGDMDIPKAFRSSDSYRLSRIIIIIIIIDSPTYRATLCHKLNHSFQNNCQFSDIQHPVYGYLPCAVATKRVGSHQSHQNFYPLSRLRPVLSCLSIINTSCQTALGGTKNCTTSYEPIISAVSLIRDKL